MPLVRHRRLQDRERILELPDAVAHLVDLLVQLLRVREDEPVREMVVLYADAGGGAAHLVPLPGGEDP